MSIGSLLLCCNDRFSLFCQVEKNAAAGRTPSSLPMPTPPPASLNASSPDFAPLSPVNANPLNDAKLNIKPEPAYFNLPPSSYNEENRSVNSRALNADYSSNERFMGGGMFVLLIIFYLVEKNEKKILLLHLKSK